MPVATLVIGLVVATAVGVAWDLRQVDPTGEQVSPMEGPEPWVVGAAGGLLAVIAIALVVVLQRSEDHTHKALAEATRALRAREARLRSLLDSAQDAIITADADGIILEWNSGAEALFGYTADEAVGQQVAMVVSERLHAQHLEGLARVAAGGERRVIGKPVELAGLRKDRTEVPVELSLAEWREDRGLRFTGILRDITERQEQRAAVQRAHQELEAVFSGMTDPFVAFDRDWRYTYLNEHAEPLLPPDTTADDVIGRRLWDVYPALIGTAIEERLRRAMEAQTPATYDEHDEESATWWEVRVFPQDNGLSVAFRDITEKHELEKLREQARAAAEEANRAKSAFLANMSHEIRTPLNAVLGMTAILASSDLTDEQRQHLATIHRSGEHLLSVINEILDLSKIEAGRLDLEARPFSVRRCIEDALDVVAPRGKEKALDLAYRIEEGVPEGLVGDEVRLRQALINLLDNAVKFTPAGSVFLGARLVEQRDGRARIELRVEDPGIGIEPEKAERLFQAFAQGDTSMTRQYGGTGLGLVITRRIAEHMDGDVRFESQAGEGTTFFLTVELPVATDTASLVAPIHIRDLRDHRLLVVDDNATNLAVVTHHLDRWGATYRATKDPAEALAWVQAGEPFDVALLDQAMPGMDGLELARRLAALRGPEGLPIVLVTSLSTTRAEIEQGGVFLAGLVHKPVKPSTLFESVAVALGHAHASLHGRPKEDAVFDVTMAERLPLAILLVEDDPLNQTVAVEMLRHLGYEPDVVADGAAAVEAVRSKDYDVVLMDVQMPGTDGLQATRAIREAGDDLKQPRIVALTAAASREDRQACRAAGMDDYLSKPVAVDDLIGALNRASPSWTPGTQASEPASASSDASNQEDAAVATTSKEGTALVDAARLDTLRHVLGDGPEGVQGLIDEYLASAPGDIAAIRDAIAAGDPDEAWAAAHKLNGTSGTLGLRALQETCRRIEEVANEGRLEQAETITDALDALLEETSAALRARDHGAE